MEFIERHDPEGDDQGSFSHRFNKRNLKNLFYSKIAGSPVVGIDRTTSSKFEENLDREINFLLKRVFLAVIISSSPIDYYFYRKEEGRHLERSVFPL